MLLHQEFVDICLLVPSHLEKWGYIFFARSSRESGFVPPPKNPRRRPWIRRISRNDYLRQECYGFAFDDSKDHDKTKKSTKFGGFFWNDAVCD